MGVEANAFAPDGRRQIQMSASLNDPLQFYNRFSRAIGVQSITITTETDMLNDMQARQARDRLIRKRQTTDIGSHAGQSVLPHHQRTIVEEDGRHMRGEHPDRQDARADIDML